MSDDDLLPSWVNEGGRRRADGGTGPGDDAREGPDGGAGADPESADAPRRSDRGPSVFDVESEAPRAPSSAADHTPRTGSGRAVFDVGAPPPPRPPTPVASAGGEPDGACVDASAPRTDTPSPAGRGGEVFDVDAPARAEAPAVAVGRAWSSDEVFDVDAPDRPGRESRDATARLDDDAVEVDHSSDSAWVAIAPLSGSTFPLGDPAAAWPDGPEVDDTPVGAGEMTGLWLAAETGRESPLRIDGQPIDPRDAGVDADLALRLLDWSDMWQRDYDPATGWRPRARPNDFEALGRHLARQLKDAVGATDVTLYLSHLGRSGVIPVPPAPDREPDVVRLMNDYGARMPVWGEFVTEAGVGSFSSELNLKLEAWAEVFAENMDPEHGWRRPEIARAYRAQAHALAQDMRAELGPDYRVDVDLWELGD